MQDIISIWNTSSYQQHAILRNKTFDELSTEHVIIYQQDRLNCNKRENNSQSILHQFNLDFDREHIYLNNKRCRDRLSFMKFITPTLSKSKHLDHILLMCQQTIFSYILKDLYDLLSAHNIDYLVIDGGKPVYIYISEIQGKKDFSIRAKKHMRLVNENNCESIVGTIDIEIVSESVCDPLIYGWLTLGGVIRPTNPQSLNLQCPIVPDLIQDSLNRTSPLYNQWGLQINRFDPAL